MIKWTNLKSIWPKPVRPILFSINCIKLYFNNLNNNNNKKPHAKSSCSVFVSINKMKSVKWNHSETVNILHTTKSNTFNIQNIHSAFSDILRLVASTTMKTVLSFQFKKKPCRPTHDTPGSKIPLWGGRWRELKKIQRRITTQLNWELFGVFWTFL